MTDLAPHRPDTVEALEALFQGAIAEQRSLHLQGTGSKSGFGPMPPETNTGAVVETVDLSAFSGILDYDPAEMVLTAGAATPMAEILAALDEAGQHMAFEPPDPTGLYGDGVGKGSLGGLVATNWAGPRRISAGAVRDHVLGFKAVSGRGEAFKSGAKVVKNVTGFDLPKILTGSHGALAALTEISIKVLPRPEAGRSVVLFGLSAADAVGLLSAALGSPHEVSGAAHLPSGVAERCGGFGTAAGDASATVVRVEGPEASAVYRAEALKELLAGLAPHADVQLLDQAASQQAWAAIRDATPLASRSDRLIWRTSVAPMAGPALLDALSMRDGFEDLDAMLDWGGGLVWLSLPDASVDGGAEMIRAEISALGGGHATLMRAPEVLRARIPVFQPQPGPLAKVQQRIKDGFDPTGILFPGQF
ncbi:MAG: FAD-binding protein [Rhodospirillaceae bacterium]